MDGHIICASLVGGEAAVILSVGSNIHDGLGDGGDVQVLDSGGLTHLHFELLGIACASGSGSHNHIVTLASFELDGQHEIVVGILGSAVRIVSTISGTPAPSLAVFVVVNHKEVVNGSSHG